MAELKTKHKVLLIVIAGIVLTALLIGGIIFLGWMVLVYADYGEMYNFYAETDGYEYFDFTVKYVISREGSNSAYIYIDSIDLDDYYSRYADKYPESWAAENRIPYWDALRAEGQTYFALLEKGFFDNVEEGTVLTVYTHPKSWWHDWAYPLVGVSIGDEEYLDFETGKQYWLDMLKQWSEDMGFRQTPIKDDKRDYALAAK